MSMDGFFRRHKRAALLTSTFSSRYPKLYIGLAAAFMLLGYAFLFMFPYLVFEGILVLINKLSNIKTAAYSSADLIEIGSWLAVVILGLFVSRQILQLHFPRVQGLKLSKELAPGLYNLVAGVGEYTTRPAIRNIILTDQYELRIEQTPRLGYPFWLNNTLVIGLPMLQTLSEEQFRCELMRRLSQYSSGRLRPCHWVFRTRLLWRRYLDSLEKHSHFSHFLLRGFFSVYTPLFELVTFPAARTDELAGDSTVLEWINDRDYFNAMMSSTFAKLFLDGHYRQKVYQSALKNPKIALKPFKNLEQAIGQFTSKEFRQKWLHGAFSAEQNYFNAMPSLRTRMENIGQSKLRDLSIIEKSAAQTLLGSARKNFVSLIDKLWYSTTFTQWKVNYAERRHNLKTVKEISRKSQKKVLSVIEVRLYARYAKQLRGDSLRSSYVKMFKRNVKNCLPASLKKRIFPRKGKSLLPEEQTSELGSGFNSELNSELNTGLNAEKRANDIS